MVAESLESLPIMIFRGHDGSDGEVMQFFDALISPILGKIEECFSREVTTRPTTLGSEANIPMDDTSGWQNLETSVKLSVAYVWAVVGAWCGHA